MPEENQMTQLDIEYKSNKILFTYVHYVSATIDRFENFCGTELLQKSVGRS